MRYWSVNLRVNTGHTLWIKRDHTLLTSTLLILLPLNKRADMWMSDATKFTSLHLFYKTLQITLKTSKTDICKVFRLISTVWWILPFFFLTQYYKFKFIWGMLCISSSKAKLNSFHSDDSFSLKYLRIHLSKIINKN